MALASLAHVTDAATLTRQGNAQDPRYTGHLSETRKKYHDNSMSLYGTEVNGHLLGAEGGRR